MINFTISIFGSKTFLEIINEIKLFSKFKIQYYEDLNLCVEDAEKHNSLVVFFVDKENVNCGNQIDEREIDEREKNEFKEARETLQCMVEQTKLLIVEKQDLLKRVEDQELVNRDLKNRYERRLFQLHEE